MGALLTKLPCPRHQTGNRKQRDSSARQRSITKLTMTSSRQGSSSGCEPLLATSRPISSESLEKTFLQCSVCRERFNTNTRSPRQLQCHHTFCLQCLTSIAEMEQDDCDGRRRNSLKCPTCRQENNLGRKGLQQIPADYKIVQLMDFLSDAKKKSHNFCQNHSQQPLNFFCKTCEVPVCKDCTVVLHRKTKSKRHKVIEISEALREFSPQLINTRDRVQKMSEELQDRSSIPDKAIAQLIKNQANEEFQIRKAFAVYRTKLEEREEALLSQLKENVSRDKGKIGVLRNLLEDNVSTFRKLDEQFEKARKQKDIRQLFQIKQKMEKWERSSIGLTINNLNYDPQWYKYLSQNEDLFELEHIEVQPGLLQQEFEPGTQRVMGYAVAIYDYTAAETSQVDLRVNDTIAILSKIDRDRGWWMGENLRTDRAGYIPLEYVREVDECPMYQSEQLQSS